MSLVTNGCWVCHTHPEIDPSSGSSRGKDSSSGWRGSRMCIRMSFWLPSCSMTARLSKSKRLCSRTARSWKRPVRSRWDAIALDSSSSVKYWRVCRSVISALLVTLTVLPSCAPKTKCTWRWSITPSSQRLRRFDARKSPPFVSTLQARDMLQATDMDGTHEPGKVGREPGHKHSAPLESGAGRRCCHPSDERQAKEL